MEHDLRLVVVAAVVCFAACMTAFRLFSRIRGSQGMVRAAWLLLTGLVAGSGVWATHFIAMLAYAPGLPTGYEPLGTLASLMIAVVVIGGGFAVGAARRDSDNQVAGGVLIGLGVAAMHYEGMAAFQTQGEIVWEHAIVGASVLFGVVGAVAALLVAGRARTLSRQLMAGSLFAMGVCALHFTSMGAITVIPDPTVVVPEQLLSGGVLTFAITGITSMIVLGGLGAVVIEAQTSRSALERTRRLANAAYEGIVVVEEGRVNDANAAFCALVGASLDEVRGMWVEGELLAFDGAVGARDVERRREAMLRPRDGSVEIPVEVFARVLDDGRRTESAGLFVLAIRDLRERRSAEEKIRYLAEHDGLTGLPNRNALQTRLSAALDRVEASREGLALLCLDLDKFKEANDLHGHAAGDALLVEAANRISEILPAPSFAARLGGDEFVIVQIGGRDQPAAAAELANRILESLRKPFIYEGHELSLSVSIGVSLCPDDGRTAAALMANADMALYRAKESGRDRYRFFKREMDETIRERRSLARELKAAIAAEELMVYYQPQARTSDGEVCGFEALVRWNHPTRGMIPPVEFIPIAEESGLIEALGAFVLNRACADAVAWERPLNVAVNLSPLQLNQPGLSAMVHGVLIESGLPPRRLELEVTESALFKDYQRALDNLRQLKALGVRIAMDDFGTGYSSLSTLQSFPFDKLKIDKSFVESIHRHDRATAIVKAVLSLGRSLDIPVVAEGVETGEQLAFLRGENCAEVQGYAIGRPAPVETLANWTNPLARKTAPRRRSTAA
ncbi:EAL domain-containing protein [Caulobacter segnis]|uniref:bifunctional diguanylate cyclase/phosphodiesterase n=1 Tax=Caulobacter segnis TaxID=88688 RepID=UPI00240ECA9E|nr:EAL domain-containing protein [Caulobacter segnis]MDG2521562.1 EAL domain-containing protein [Caulobacter segnis]